MSREGDTIREYDSGQVILFVRGKHRIQDRSTIKLHRVRLRVKKGTDTKFRKSNVAKERGTEVCESERKEFVKKENIRRRRSVVK